MGNLSRIFAGKKRGPSLSPQALIFTWTVLARRGKIRLYFYLKKGRCQACPLPIFQNLQSLRADH